MIPEGAIRITSPTKVSIGALKIIGFRIEAHHTLLRQSCLRPGLVSNDGLFVFFPVFPRLGFILFFIDNQMTAILGF